MGIRVGSGGLKFQPVNHAQINARQSAAAASAGGSASASAYGANRRYALGQQRLQHSSLQAALGRQNQRYMQGQAYQNQLGLNQQRYNLQQQGLDAEYQQALATDQAIGPPPEQTETPYNNAPPGATPTPAGNANSGPPPVNNAAQYAAVAQNGVYWRGGKMYRKQGVNQLGYRY